MVDAARNIAVYVAESVFQVSARDGETCPHDFMSNACLTLSLNGRQRGRADSKQDTFDKYSIL